MTPSLAADGGSTDLGKTVERGEAALEGVSNHLEGVDSLDALDAETCDAVETDLETLRTVAEELGDVFETVDLSALQSAVDGDDVLEAVEGEEVLSSLSEGDIGGAVDVTALFDAVDLIEAWNASELVDLVESGRELADATDAIGGDDDDSGLGMDLEFDGEDALEGLDADPLENPEYVQVAIQQGAIDAIDAVRSALLEAHETFENVYEWNRERMRRTDRGTNSRNPTAASTMPVDRADLGSDGLYSTVPTSVRHSTAPARRRIYGRRFKIERERQRGER